MRSFLLALYPRRWRQRYGAELRALLEATDLTPAVAADLVRAAAAEHLRQRPVTVRLLLALIASAVVEVMAARADLTHNVLWPPTTFARALALLALLLVWAPTAHEVLHRRSAHPPVAGG